MRLKWLEWVKEMQAIAQTGLEYSRDVYDLERFEQLRRLSVEILAAHTELDTDIVRGLFANERGYATPKVDIRAVIVCEGRVLLVREKLDGAWSLPGGWADIGLSPTEVAVKEAKEESGFDVHPVRLLAVLDKGKHEHPPSPYDVYKMFIHCEIIGGAALSGVETSEVAFFAPDALPELSAERNNAAQILAMLRAVANPGTPVHVD